MQRTNFSTIFWSVNWKLKNSNLIYESSEGFLLSSGLRSLMMEMSKKYFNDLLKIVWKEVYELYL